MISKQHKRALFYLLLISLGGPGCLEPIYEQAHGEKGPSIYTVSKYDPARSAEDDLAATIRRAKEEGKRIILEIGGQW